MNNKVHHSIITKIMMFVFLVAAQNSFCKSANLIPLASNDGRQILLNTHLNKTFLTLSATYTTQQNQSYCGIASSVMVLNALNIKPQKALFGTYEFIDQDNFFSDPVLRKISQQEIIRSGLTLDQLGDILKIYPVNVMIIHAEKNKYHQFLQDLAETFRNSDHYIIINFLRTTLGQSGVGHFSPIAAYDSKSDKVLVMDVARYKFYPYWVSTHDLWSAMQTIDNTSSLTRGYLLIKK